MFNQVGTEFQRTLGVYISCLTVEDWNHISESQKYMNNPDQENPRIGLLDSLPEDSRSVSHAQIWRKDIAHVALCSVFKTDSDL